jgi:hypothetical protein
MPNPGSDEAIDAGCICPVLDNSHGWGYMRQGVFVYHEGCLVHAEKVAEIRQGPVISLRPELPECAKSD